MNGPVVPAPGLGPAAAASPDDPAGLAPGWTLPPGRLAGNVMQFGRVLRATGMPVGSDRIALALQALAHAGIGSRRDFHDVLAACLVDRVEHRELFGQAFALFWRDPDVAGRALASRLPALQGRHDTRPEPRRSRRLGDALHPAPAPRPAAEPERVEIEVEASWSARELLRKADFETMSADEWRQALALVKRLELLAEPLPTRRWRPAPGPGRADGRATLQALARHGGDVWTLRWRRRRERPAPLVVLADISGSMSRYSRMLLHFAHALGHADARVESFVFGTRLTRTTRALRQRDPDLAVERVVATVDDWSGGTRIRDCLADFNRHWARRVLSGRATVLLITDGLEHGDAEALRFEMERLRKSCRRLIWLNPLLRWSGFEPRAAGIRAMLPQVDAFLPAHNLESLADLARVLSGASAATTGNVGVRNAGVRSRGT